MIIEACYRWEWKKTNKQYDHTQHLIAISGNNQVFRMKIIFMLVNLRTAVIRCSIFFSDNYDKSNFEGSVRGGGWMTGRGLGEGTVAVVSSHRAVAHPRSPSNR